MRTIKVQKLTQEAFALYGEFHDLLAPDVRRYVSRGGAIEFWPDLCSAIVGGESICYSTCIVAPRPFVVDVSEYHTNCSEGNLPLDQDVVMHFAPASTDGRVPLDRMEAFLIPAGTMVTIRPGVWHHAGFTLTDRPAATLVALPPRTYANDCVVQELDPADQVVLERP